MNQNVKPIRIKPGDSKDEKQSNVETISSKALNLCKELELFHNQEGKAFSVAVIGGHQEIFEIAGLSFKRWLQNRFYSAYNKGISTHIFKEIVSILEAKAHCIGEQKVTSIRIATIGENIYIDLCNKKRQCVEIRANGWSILDRSPVMFVRKERMLELPLPQLDGDISLLEKYLNIYSNDFPLIVAWILGALRGRPPYPILIFQGGQGSGKSTNTEILRKLIDPSDVLLRGELNDERDLVASIVSGYVFVMDNTSSIKPSMADTLCRLSTGGGFSRRKMFTDSDEMLIKLSNPIIINGICSLPDRPDLLERSIILELPTITSNRQCHQEIMEAFEKDLPLILGGFYTVLSKAIQIRPNIQLKNPPRMADFGYFVAAAEKAMDWPEDSILKCLESNQQDLAENSIESNTFISAILEFMKVRIEFSGTAQELLDEVNRVFQNNSYRQCPDWPRTPHKVGQLLSRYSPYLKRMGYAIIRTKSPDKQSKRIINIAYEELLN
jgi:hypothetical protein